MTDDMWRSVQEKTGCDIMDIVMDAFHGRATAGRTMERIAEHCNACYEEGRQVGLKEAEKQHQKDFLYGVI